VSVLEKLKSATGIDDLAAMLGYKPSAISFILYKLPPAAKYTAFQIPKKSGGMRDICAPIEPLKSLQRRLANILYACCDQIDEESGLGSLSHGFRRGHSIVTNAQPHHRRRYVLNLDLKDFFPTFNFGRVRGFFIKNKAFELNEKVATLIAQIACHENALPQGSPCSPIISDLLGHLLDVRLARLAKDERVTYSRYADDLTFSTNQKQFPEALASRDPSSGAEWVLGDKLVGRIEGAGFTINPAKTRMQCSTSRQLVTGLTVNEKVNIRPERYLEARAMCDALFKTGSYWRNEEVVVPAGAGTTVVKTKVPITSLGPIGGMLSHIHHVKDQIDRRDEIEKRKNKTTFRKLFHRFLFYKYFARPSKPLIVCEGKTDNVYLSLAIKHLAAFHPKLGSVAASGFIRAISFFSHTNQSQAVLELNDGSGNFKHFIRQYKQFMDVYDHKPKAYPVIILIDNDDGAKDIFATIDSNFKIKITWQSSDPFYHVVENLYLVKTPHVGSKLKTCIEDLFEPALLKTKIAGKSFNPNKKHGAVGEYGKDRFSKEVVRVKADTIKWDGFTPLLESIVGVMDHYSSLPVK
jgi:hypothetical protein